MSEAIYSNGMVRLCIAQIATAQFFILRVKWLFPGRWQTSIYWQRNRHG